MSGRLLSTGMRALFVLTCGVIPGVLAAQQSAVTRGATAAARKASVRDSVVADSVARDALRADELFYERRLLNQRALFLKGASWADLGDRCNPGALRIFADATTPAAMDSIQALVEHMEQTIIARGVGTPLNTPEAGTLLRTVVGWEAGIDRPLWDVDEGPLRIAIAAGLTGDVPDPKSDGCLHSPMVSDTVTFVIPGFSSMEFPNAPKPRVKAYFGRDAQQHARDEFYKYYGSRDPTSDFSYFLVAPVVIWRNWALVGVDRPIDKGGIEIRSGSNGGAVYMMRRVGTQWRLVTVVRSWAR